jgi:uncharacterized protein YkwD
MHFTGIMKRRFLFGGITMQKIVLCAVMGIMALTAASQVWAGGSVDSTVQDALDRLDRQTAPGSQPAQGGGQAAPTSPTAPTGPVVQDGGQDQRSAPNANDSSGWDIRALDTARSAAYLSDLEKDIILEMNMARSNPQKYAELYINPNQGAFARECYEEFRRAKSLPVLLPKRGLSQAAKDHAADIGPKGLTDHTGSNGSSLGDRINRYGTWRSGASENLSFGYNTAREIVLQLLIDDGVQSREHRKNIMDANARFVGVAAGTHSRYRFMCVQDFAHDYTDK